MPSCFPNRIQVISCVIAVLTFVSNGWAQPVSLDAELDSENGLIDNSIRVIRRDDKGRMWIGTDHGLQILPDLDSVFRPLVGKIGDNPLWALEFYRQFVFVGTRFKGVYIYDLQRNKVAQYFDSAQIGLSRRFKLIHDTVFLATRGEPVFFVHDGRSWRVKQINSGVSNGFTTDFVAWRNGTYSSTYSDFSYHLRRFPAIDTNNTETIREQPQTPSPHQKARYGSWRVLSMASDDSTLLLGGDGYYSMFWKNGQFMSKYLFGMPALKLYPVWDALLVEGRPVLAIGSPESMQEGMLLTDTSMDVSRTLPNFYGQSLYYQSQHKALWAGTNKRGLFYWPYMHSSHYTPADAEGEMNMLTVSADSVFLFNKHVILLQHRKTNRREVLYRRETQELLETDVSDLALSGEELFILFNNQVMKMNLKQRRLEDFCKLEGGFGLYRKIVDHGDFLLVFSMFHDKIMRVNKKSRTSALFSTPSNLISIAGRIGDRLIYHSNYSGFHSFDTAVHSLRLPLPTINSTAMTGDTLWVLSGGKILSYKISILADSVTPILEKGFRITEQNFHPDWLQSVNGQLYLGNHQGFFFIDKQTGEPGHYWYLGNYSKGLPPVAVGQAMYFNRESYYTRIDTTVLNDRKTPAMTMAVLPSGTLYQLTAFSFQFASDDQIALKHSYKKIELWRSNQLVREWSTLSDRIDVQNGMPPGDYLLKVYVNGKKVLEQPFEVEIPLSVNPVFYISVTVFFLLFFLLLFKYFSNKKQYERKLLDNRLQLLKQNLNPHFIFNSLNLIYSLVQQNRNDAAIRSISNFSDLHRYYLTNINKSVIDLSEEMDFIKSYLKLESKRVEIDDPFAYDLPEEAAYIGQNFSVPPMILQPLVENAVRYSGSVDGMRTIIVDLVPGSGELVIGVENTLSNVTSGKSGHGMGLHIVKERVELYNKTKKKEVRFVMGAAPRHMENGYRCELIFRWKE